MMQKRKIFLSGDYLNSNKILFHVGKRWKEILEGRTDFHPIAVEIHPTAKCNHACVHCSYKERNAARNEIPQESMERLIDSLIHMKAEAVYFSGGGEPTLYPDLAKYVKRLHRAGIEVALITNGTYFERSGLLEIADQFNYIAFSVPGASESVFQEITGTNLLQNLLRVPVKIKEMHGYRSPVLGSRIVLTDKNYKQVGAFLQLIKEHQFDYALFKVVRDYEGSGQGIGKEEEDYLRKEIEKLGDIDENFTNLNSIFHYRKPVAFLNNCWINQWGWLANISTDGKVYPNIVEIDHPEFCIGDINEQRLEDIWNSSKHQQVKELSKEKWLHGECKNCRAISYNAIVNDQLNCLPGSYDAFI